MLPCPGAGICHPRSHPRALRAPAAAALGTLLVLLGGQGGILSLAMKQSRPGTARDEGKEGISDGKLQTALAPPGFPSMPSSAPGSPLTRLGFRGEAFPWIYQGFRCPPASPGNQPGPRGEETATGTLVALTLAGS